MVNCPLCDAVLDVEEDELDEGDELTCEECGAALFIAGTNPLELEAVEDEEDEEEEEEEEDEDDLDYEEDEEEEEEDWR